MYERIKALYDADPKKITKAGVANAVVKKWITPEQYQLITGDVYPV